MNYNLNKNNDKINTYNTNNNINKLEENNENDCFQIRYPDRIIELENDNWVSNYISNKYKINNFCLETYD